MEKKQPGSLGKLAEDFVAQRLAEEGCKILKRNYRTRLGEIDIIAQKDGWILFVEVKARKAGSMVSPLEAVTRSKQKKLLLTAKAWMLKTGCTLQPRMDVAAVTVEQVNGRELVSGFEYYRSAFWEGY